MGMEALCAIARLVQAESTEYPRPNPMLLRRAARFLGDRVYARDGQGEERATNLERTDNRSNTAYGIIGMGHARWTAPWFVEKGGGGKVAALERAVRCQGQSAVHCAGQASFITYILECILAPTTDCHTPHTYAGRPWLHPEDQLASLTRLGPCDWEVKSSIGLLAGPGGRWGSFSRCPIFDDLRWQMRRLFFRYGFVSGWPVVHVVSR